MTDARAHPHLRSAIASLIVFPLVGPAAVVLAMAGPLALVGLFSLGPGGLAYAFVLATWWLPGLYILLAPPFFLTGVVLVLAAWLIRQSSVLVALLAAEVAFFAYFAFWHFVPGGVGAVAYDYANLQPGFLRSPGAVLVVLIATAVCWLIVRPRISRAETDSSGGAPASRRNSLALAGTVVVGAAALAYLPATVTLPPAEAWKNCSDTTARTAEERIRACTDVINRGDDEPLDHRVTAYVRRGGVYSERDLTRAIADFSEAIRLDPNRADAYVGRGLCHARRYEDDQTIADLDAAQRLDGNIFKKDAHRLFRARGLALVRKREFDRAIADHTDEIAQAPHYAEGYLHRAAAYLAKNDTDRAIADFSGAIRVEPFRSEGYVGRGSIYLTRGETDRALEDFDEAIRRRPNLRQTAPAYRKRGEALEKRGDLKEALAAFEKALQLDPSDQEAIAGRERTRAPAR